MAAAIKWRSKIILSKIEATYATDAAPTGAANAMLLTNVEFRPMEGEDVARDIERAFLGAQEEFAVALRAVITGSIELVGSGTAGTAPHWGPLVRACAIAETVTVGPPANVEYTPITDDQESATIHFWIGGTKHALVGARGTAELMIEAQRIPTLRVTLTGLWVGPVEAARPSPVTLTGFQVPQVATDANTPTFEIDSVPLVLRRCSFNLGNDVQPRLLIGREEILIVDRAEEIAAVVEAVPLTDFDPFALARDRTRVAVDITHGTVAGKITTISAPTCAVKRQSGYEQQQQILEWPLRLTPLPTDAGNDQYAITLT